MQLKGLGTFCLWRSCYDFFEVIVLTVQSFIFLVLLCCSVVQASERRYQIPNEDFELQKVIAQRLESAFDDETSLFMVVVCNGQRYTGVCDIRQEKICSVWTAFPTYEKTQMIMTIMDYLKNEALRGYVKRSLCRPQTDFSKELQCVGGSLSKLRYKRCVFFSQSLRVFFAHVCSGLERKGKIGWGGFGTPLTDAVLHRLELPSGQLLRFSIQDKTSALLEMVCAKKDDPIRVFVALPGFGVMRGCAVPRDECDEPIKEHVLAPECFLAQKIRALIDDMRDLYPFDEKTWKTCLNYKEV